MSRGALAKWGGIRSYWRNRKALHQQLSEALNQTAGMIEKDKAVITELAKTKEERLKAVEKEVSQIDKQILAVQKSTRTALPQFQKLHNYNKIRECPNRGDKALKEAKRTYFRMRFGWYYRWHLAPRRPCFTVLNPYSNRVHTTLLVLIISAAAYFGINPQFQSKTYAASLPAY